jgi:hypothetical protein
MRLTEDKRRIIFDAIEEYFDYQAKRKNPLIVGKKRSQVWSSMMFIILKL